MDPFNFKPRTTSEVDSFGTLGTNLKNKSLMIFLVLKVTKIGGIMVQFLSSTNELIAKKNAC